ncbi:MAG: Lrp/AsnC family transcriptional regulator, partial [Candidatus Woesearchaeota archaeon]
MELDEIDKKVLFELSQDARQSYKDIARQISSKKDTVAYHISDLQKKGIITKYVPVISIANLGLFG